MPISGAIPTLCDHFTGTLELYYTFTKHMKAESLQMNVSEVKYSKGKQGGGRSYSGKRSSSGILNSNEGISLNAALLTTVFKRSMSILIYPQIKITPFASNA
jgi:hypothetical protein